MSRITVAVKAAVDAVVSLMASTAFRHRLVMVAVPVVVEVIAKAQEAFTGADPGMQTSIAINTVALFVIYWLRGKAAPA